MEGIAKTRFPPKTFIGDSRVDFWCFLEAMGAGFLSFSALETGLKIECFSRSPWGSWMAPENQGMTVSAGKNDALDRVQQPINYFLGHNLS